MSAKDVRMSTHSAHRRTSVKGGKHSMRVDIDKQVAHAEQLEREQEIAEMQAELEKLRAEKRESNRKLKRAEDVMELGWSSQSHAGHGVISDALS